MENRIDHLAIIMDGNGRWAKGRGMPRLGGHEAGTRAARKIVEASKDRGISYLTLYAFSSENWRRPKEEVEGLFRILESFIDREIDRLMEGGVHLNVIGDLSKFPDVLREKILSTIEKSAVNSGIYLNIALNYGGRQEILDAAKKLALKYKPGELDSVGEEEFRQLLYGPSVPDPDLIVRTSGEQRISNFLLWQGAYSELVFTDVLWPDFGPIDIYKAVVEYGRRERRFGDVSHKRG